MPYEVSGLCPSSRQFSHGLEQRSHWQQIKPLHKRIFAHYVCKFGMGEDRHMEDVRSPLLSLRERAIVLGETYDDDQP
jgi:hypothetical protein